MLDFWYSKRCTRQIKLIICIAVCAIIYYCSNIQQLSPLFAGLSLAVGLALHFLRIAHLNIANTNHYKSVLNIIFSIFPIIALIALIIFLPQTHQAILALQCICFSAIGLFLVSIYENRAKRFE